MTPSNGRFRAAAVATAAVTAVAGLTVVTAGPARAADPVRIHDIQGTTRVSPDNGQTVTGVPGIVTAVRTSGSRGFWIQDTEPDTDPRTSEGIFVYTGKAPTVAVGDSVLVTAKVSEYYPDAAPATALHQSLTELSGPTVTVVSSGNPLPAPVRIGPTTVPATLSPDAGGGSIEPLTLDPTKYALDYYESIEGMRAEVDDARVVGPTDSFGELYVTTKPTQNPTPRGGTVYLGYDTPNTGRLEVTFTSPLTNATFPKANVGDTLTGATVGPIDYTQYSGYEIAATTVGALTSGGIKAEVTAKQKSGQLAIGTYNVENLAPTDPATKFQRLAQGIVTNLATPDIVSLEEIQDNSGAADDGVVAADRTLQTFTDAIVAAGGPRYQWREIDPVNDQDGGQPGGNIRVAFLFDPQRVSFVDIPGGTSTAGVTVSKGTLPTQVKLSASPGRIAPTNAAWNASRKPLVGEFRFRGRTVYVIANHFDSKLGDQPEFGRYQPPARSSEIQRTQQATLVHDFAAQIEKINPVANIVTLGDLNDYQFSPALTTLTGGRVLKDLITTLPANERYSYVFDGNSQVLDHILTSPFVLNPQYDVVHINAEFSDQASDHDPQVVRFVPTSIF